MERLVQSIPLRAAGNNQCLRLSRNTKRTTRYQSPTVWHSSSCYCRIWRSVTLTLQYDALTCGEINKHSSPAESIHSHGQKLHSTDLKSLFLTQSDAQRASSRAVITCHRRFRRLPSLGWGSCLLKQTHKRLRSCKTKRAEGQRRAAGEAGKKSASAIIWLPAEI